MTATNNEKAMEKREAKDMELTRDLPVFVPATDIYEKPDSVLVVCDMPGVDEKKVDITLEDDVLTLSGVQEAAEPEGLSPLYRGYDTGVYRRTFRLDTRVDRAGIKARLANGVLQVVLPKAEEAKPRKITVETD